MNVNNKKYKLRVFYKKIGVLAYLSHLELCRAIEYSIRRANLPYAVSQGFSPHMKISFGRALGVGIESNCQVFDIVLLKKLDESYIKKVLICSFPSNLIYKSCKYIDGKQIVCSNIYSKFKYEVILNKNISNLSIPINIEVVRKKKVKNINVSEFLHDNNIYIIFDNNIYKLIFILKTKSSGSLKPLEFIDALFLLNNLDKALINKITLVDCN